VSAPSSRPSIGAIFSVFFRIGLLSFGGGVTGWVFREVVTLRHWIEEDEFMSGLAMSQILPGTNISNLTIYLGQRLRGPLGAVVALAALLCGPFFAALALASGYSVLKALRCSDAAMDGIAAAAIGLLLIVIGRGARRLSTDFAAMAALLATFVSVGLLHWSLPLTAVVVGTISVLLAWSRTKPDEG